MRAHNRSKVFIKLHLHLCSSEHNSRGFYNVKNGSSSITVRPWDARFFGKEKTRAAQNLCNFCYIIGWRQDDQKRFSLHKFVYIKFFRTQFKNVHLRGPCSSRLCISRPYCTSKSSSKNLSNENKHWSLTVQDKTWI